MIERLLECARLVTHPRTLLVVLLVLSCSLAACREETGGGGGAADGSSGAPADGGDGAGEADPVGRGVAAVAGVEEGDGACDNLVDDDGDGFTDCEDRDCSLTSTVCTPEDSAVTCADGKDQDGDGFIDGSDDDCSESTVEACTDGLDNDGNGFVDCGDWGCSQNEELELDCPKEDTDELCSDGVDNDGDPYVDCDDYDCSRSDSVSVCGGGGGGDGGGGDGGGAIGCTSEYPEGICRVEGQICRDGACVVPGPCGPTEPNGSCAKAGHICVDSECRAFGALASPGDLIITEILPNVELDGLENAEATAEWFEVHNPGDQPVDLRGVRVRDDGRDDFVVSSPAPVVVPPLAYVVLGRSTDVRKNGGTPVLYGYGGQMALANGDDEIILEKGGVTLDRVAYTGSWPFNDGVAGGLDPTTLDADANDAQSSWCAQRTEWSEGTGQKGTPGAENDPCE